MGKNLNSRPVSSGELQDKRARLFLARSLLKELSVLAEQKRTSLLVISEL